ncbi:MAG TPA: CBS domain-containing protein [Nitrososphaeraceae archaeon]|nr:CBS domain-containing protein [Nitrososphaeraceae archaeon]
MTINPNAVNSNVNLPGGVAIMIIKSIGNLIVKQHQRPIGILTEREVIGYLANEKELPNKLLSDMVLQPFFSVHPNTTVLHAATMMIQMKGRILVFDRDAEEKGDKDMDIIDKQQDTYREKKNKNEKLVGIITASDMVRAFSKTTINPSLESIMTRRIFDVDFDSHISNAIDIMYKERIGSVIVNKDEKPYGIFTERDLLTKILSKEVRLDERVGDYCPKELITGEIGKMGMIAGEAAETMHIAKIKRLPLRKDHKIVGIVTARDLVELYQSQSHN